MRAGKYLGTVPLAELRSDVDLMLALRLIEPSGACPYRLTTAGARILALATESSQPDSVGDSSTTPSALRSAPVVGLVLVVQVPHACDQQVAALALRFGDRLFLRLEACVRLAAARRFDLVAAVVDGSTNTFLMSPC